MKIALAQMNPTVGDIRGNVRRIREWIGRAQKAGADLVVFPEMAVTGYPPRDLVDFPRFIEKNIQAVQELAAQVDTPAAIVGFVDKNPAAEGKRLLNAAALLGRRKILGVRYKTLLPTYDVFDEARYFAPASNRIIFRFRFTSTSWASRSVKTCGMMLNSGPSGCMRKIPFWRFPKRALT